MTRPPTGEVRTAIMQFRAIVEGDSAVDYCELAAALTKLLDTAARMKGEPAGEGPDLERRDALADSLVVRERFSDLHVETADDKVASDEWTIMPVGDLDEIYHDMRVVEDTFESGDEMGARWDFRFGFEHHWGEHALSLIGYLLRSYRY